MQTFETECSCCVCGTSIISPQTDDDDSQVQMEEGIDYFGNGPIEGVTNFDITVDPEVDEILSRLAELNVDPADVCRALHDKYEGNH